MPARSPRSMRTKWVSPGSDRPHKSIWTNLSAGCGPRACSERAQMIRCPNWRAKPTHRGFRILVCHDLLRTLQGEPVTGKESTEPLDVRLSPPSYLTHASEATIFDTEDPRALDVDDFRMRWQQGLDQEATKNRSRGWKVTRMAVALAAVAIVGSAFSLKVGAPSLPERPSAYNGPVKAQPPGGETIATSTDAGRLLGKDSAPSTQVKVGNEQLVDLITQAPSLTAPQATPPSMRRTESALRWWEATVTP